MRVEIWLLDFHARLGAVVGGQQENARTFAARGEHGALRLAEAHLARLQVCDHDRQPADQLGRIVGRLDACEHLAGLCADVELQLEQLLRAFDVFRAYDSCDAQIDFVEVLDRNSPLAPRERGRG